MEEIYSKLELNDFNIMDKILSEQDRIIWESMGLTPDVQSMENAALLSKVFLIANIISHFPLILQGQAGFAMIFRTHFLY